MEQDSQPPVDFVAFIDEMSHFSTNLWPFQGSFSQTLLDMFQKQSQIFAALLFFLFILGPGHFFAGVVTFFLFFLPIFALGLVTGFFWKSQLHTFVKEQSGLDLPPSWVKERFRGCILTTFLVTLYLYFSGSVLLLGLLSLPLRFLIIAMMSEYLRYSFLEDGSIVGQYYFSFLDSVHYSEESKKKRVVTLFLILVGLLYFLPIWVLYGVLFCVSKSSDRSSAGERPTGGTLFSKIADLLADLFSGLLPRSGKSTTSHKQVTLQCADCKQLFELSKSEITGVITCPHCGVSDSL